MDIKVGKADLDINLISPFYFIVDKDLKIISVGKSLDKLFPNSVDKSLEEVLKMARPWSIKMEFDAICTQLKKVFVFQNKERELVLRGQLILLEEESQLIFLGSPWMNTTDELVKHKLALTDFALNDPTPDAIQLLKMNEINLNELKEMTVRLKAQKTDIQKKETLYRGLVENASEMISRCDLEGKLLYVNPASMKITGYSEEELNGKVFFNLISSDQRADITRKFRRQLVEKIDKDVYEFSIVSKTGKKVWLLQTVIAIQDADGEVQGYTSVGVDISLRKEMEETLENARQKALESARIKERFIANTSHELRTPMNAIIGLSNLLIKTPLLPKQTEFIEAIRTSAENLLVVINDVLDISKIESEKLEIEFIDFDLKEKISLFVKSLSIRATEKNIVLKHVWDDNVHPTILGDPYRLNQVLTNLVSNAIKFTTKGEVRLEVMLDKVEDDKQFVCFKVIDTGEGIPKEKHESIFDGFSQADASVTRKFGGTGLGLTISRSLVELMGGTIVVESEVGVGSTFTVNIPFEMCDDVESDKSALDVPEEVDWSEFKVLVVEDNQFNQLLAENILNQWKLQIEMVNNGEEAINILKTHTFDIILMDIQMPVMDGIEATNYIRNTLQIGTPIIALTANAMKDDLAYYKQIGMNSCVTKPFQQDDLQNELYKLLINKDVVDEHEVDLSPWKGKRILVVEDNEFNQLLVTSILTEWGLEVHKSDDGYQALEEIEKVDFDLILMDIKMPKMDGIETTKIIRKNQEKSIPIIAFSAHLTEEIEKTFLEVGMNGCIPKPFKVGQLKKIIHDVFSLNNEDENIIQKPKEGWQGKKVLVVEDNMFNQLLVVNILEGWGMEIVTAENGKEAVEKFEEHTFDIVLMDIQMPVMDGIEATKLIRQKFDENLPIIALTANSGADDQKLYRMSGMNACVAKPFDLDEFEMTIKKFLTNDKLISKEAEPEPLENNQKKVLIVEDNPFNILLLRGILEQWDLEIDEAENGKIAVDLVKVNNYDLILMDIQMPEMDGVEATEIIRNDLNIQKPIIAITANSQPDLVKKYFKAGMNGCIPKPYGQEELQKSIMKYL
ncbi:response regulator [Flammeovirga sp. EKP202]|uniref:response regulator n=1 Tax=Flammeovirga sp. EKP202 TaxID=2770592 RepID=UPI00165F035C|nr:response regulator [Flammeovirga sp. EKP202]MBD0402331.1 response regulator [Flammeovirga sp. EKP202]